MPAAASQVQCYVDHVSSVTVRQRVPYGALMVERGRVGSCRGRWPNPSLGPLALPDRPPTHVAPYGGSIVYAVHHGELSTGRRGSELLGGRVLGRVLACVCVVVGGCGGMERVKGSGGVGRVNGVRSGVGLQESGVGGAARPRRRVPHDGGRTLPCCCCFLQ